MKAQKSKTAKKWMILLKILTQVESSCNDKNEIKEKFKFHLDLILCKELKQDEI